MGGCNVRRILTLLLCIGFSYLLAASIRNAARGVVKAVDFGAIYYEARCVIEHKDPYEPRIVMGEFESDGRRFSTNTPKEARENRTIISVAVYPPTALLVAVPLAFAPWPVAREVWVTLIASLLVLAAYLIWDMSSEAPILSGYVLSFILLNCFVVILAGNPAGVVVPCCVIAVWCFVEQRYAALGAILLAVALALKPHDAGFIWLYFLVARGPGRRRALQTLGIIAVLGICAYFWITAASPHWIQELHNNLAMVSAHGSTSDPGPSGLDERGMAPIISLQNSASVFGSGPNVYNAVSYAIGGGLIVIWAFAAFLKPFTTEGALLALAAISALGLLPVYHRPDDAKLLLLAIPACASMWAAGRAKRWIALGLTSAAIIFTSDGPLMLWTAATSGLAFSGSTISGKVGLMLLQPAPLLLLATGCFYLWVYIRYQPSSADEPIRDSMVLTASGQPKRI